MSRAEIKRFCLFVLFGLVFLVGGADCGFFVCFRFVLLFGALFCFLLLFLFLIKCNELS